MRRPLALTVLAVAGYALTVADLATAEPTPVVDAPIPTAPAVDDGPCPEGTVDPLAEWPTAYYEPGAWFIPPRVLVATARFEDECARPVEQPMPTTAPLIPPDGGCRVGEWPECVPPPPAYPPSVPTPSPAPGATLPATR